MISLAMHVKGMEQNLESEINNISKEDGIAEATNLQHFVHEFAQVTVEVNKIQIITPRIEQMQTDLGILDAQENEKDVELEQMPASLIKIIKKNEEIIKTSFAEKEKVDQL